MDHSMMTDRLLTRQEVEERCGLSCSTIYRMMREDLDAFPTPIRVARRSVRWKESEIEGWLASRPRATGDFPPVASTRGGAARPVEPR